MNCHFEVDDAEDDWNFSYKFEYIHGRALLTSFKSHLPVIKSSFDFLVPGGYLELQDCIYGFRCVDDSTNGSSLQSWVNLIMKGTAALGKIGLVLQTISSILSRQDFKMWLRRDMNGQLEHGHVGSV